MVYIVVLLRIGVHRLDGLAPRWVCVAEWLVVLTSLSLPFLSLSSLSSFSLSLSVGGGRMANEEKPASPTSGLALRSHQETLPLQQRRGGAHSVGHNGYLAGKLVK